MSNIGKQVIYPADVEITIRDYKEGLKTLIFKGPLGMLFLNLPNDLFIDFGDSVGGFKIYSNNSSQWGLINRMIQQSITGVSIGFTKQLELKGIGYSCLIYDNKLVLNVGHSHTHNLEIPSYIKVKCTNNTTINAMSYNYRKLMEWINKIILIKPATKDHYKGKGIKKI